ncbi:protein kinase [Alishewanella longhuensis]
MKLDGYKVLQELFASSRSHLYLVEDENSGQQLVLKCPSLNYDDDALYTDRFIQRRMDRMTDSVRICRQSCQNTVRGYLQPLPDAIPHLTTGRIAQPVAPSVLVPCQSAGAKYAGYSN